MLDGLLDPAHPWKTLIGGVLLVLLGLAIFGLKYTKTWKWLGSARLPVIGFGAIAGVLGGLTTVVAIMWLVNSMIVVATLLFLAAAALVSVARKQKAKNKPVWIPLQLVGSGIGLVSFVLFFKLVS